MWAAARRPCVLRAVPWRCRDDKTFPRLADPIGYVDKENIFHCMKVGGGGCGGCEQGVKGGKDQAGRGEGSFGLAACIRCCLASRTYTRSNVRC